MATVNARTANQTFSQLLAEVEEGETVVITKNGRVVAELRPRLGNRRDDPEWCAAFEAMQATLAEWPQTSTSIGALTEDDKYGDAVE